MLRVVCLITLAGCGRIAFDSSRDGGTSDAGSDGAGPDVMMIDPVGQLDTSFGGTGMIQPSSAGESIGYDLVARGTGYLIAGVDYAAAGGAHMNLIALKEGGALDPSWAGTGEMIVKAMSAVTSFAYGIHVLPNNDLLFIGDAEATGADDFVVSRFDQAGVFDPSFGGVDGFVTYNITPPGTGGDTARRAVTVGGTTYVCGNADYDGDMRVGLIALDATDGSFVTNFGTGGMVSGNYTAQEDECNDITTDGSFLYAVGRNAGAAVLFRYDLTGAAIPMVTVLRTGNAFSLTRMTDGSLYLAGVDGTTGFVIKMQDFTAFDPSFGGAGTVAITGDAFEDLTVDAQGRIVVVGRRNNQFPVIRRFLPTGVPDSTFGTNGALAITNVPSGGLHSVIIDPVGRIVAVGWIDGGLNDLMVLRVN